MNINKLYDDLVVEYNTVEKSYEIPNRYDRLEKNRHSLFLILQKKIQHLSDDEKLTELKRAKELPLFNTHRYTSGYNIFKIAHRTWAHTSSVNKINREVENIEERKQNHYKAH